MHCYVYFKAAAEDEQHIRQCFARLRLSLEKIGFNVRFQRRPEVKDGLQTWMEVYENVPDHFEELIAAVVAESGLNEYIVGARYYERFLEIHPSSSL